MINPPAADRWLETMERHFNLLGTKPGIGVEREDLLPALRALPVGNYLIFYRPRTDGVEILRVIHGARDYGSHDF